MGDLLLHKRGGGFYSVFALAARKSDTHHKKNKRMKNKRKN